MSAATSGENMRRKHPRLPGGRGMAGLMLLTIAVLAIPGLSGCAPQRAEAAGLVLRGPHDLIPLMDTFRRELGPVMHQEIIVEPSTTSIEDLRQGTCTIAFAARELGSSSTGLQDTVIGHDAVCILIDENSYFGGEYWAGSTRVRRTSGLQNMTYDELVSSVGFWAAPPAERLLWGGGYECWTPGGWREEETVVFNVFSFPAGKFDTQTVLFESLRLDEAAVVKAMGHYTSDTMNTEAEVLAKEYKVGAPYEQYSGDFMFKLGFASRCVSRAAVTKVPVRVVTIDGVDPLATPEAVYNRTYPLTRDIHLFASLDGSKTANTIIDWALSAEGQAAIAEAGYLPLKP
jgi:hypothetical protein